MRQSAVGEEVRVGVRPVEFKLNWFVRIQDEEQDLSEAFKRRLGLVSHTGADEMLDETVRELAEVSSTESRDVEREATLTRAKFDKFARSFFQTKNSHVHSRQPITEPLLAKKHELDRTVRLCAVN